MATTFPGFSDFLKQTKDQYLKDLAAKNVDKWTVVMGNEAGDLDTIASSLSYSYLATNLQNTPTVALIQTRRTDFYLRKENNYAISLAHLDDNHQDLLCIDDIPSDVALNSIATKYVLVDHNVLEDAFQGGSGKVVGIIDHHADEKQHLDAAFRDIEIAGSCTSLVTRHFLNDWTPHTSVANLGAGGGTANTGVSQDVATILLTGVTIDTGGLTDEDITKQVDQDSARFLYVNSSYAAGGSFQGEQSLENLEDDLKKRKKDISDLSTKDLLRRDYKDAEYPDDTGNVVHVGLSTVPMGLEDWQDRDGKKKFWDAVEDYLNQSNLGVLGILTTFKKKHKKNRELLFMTDKDKISGDAEQRLFDGLANSDALQLKETDKLGKPNHPKHTRVWDQKNTDANRKIIAPLVESLIRNTQSS